MAELFYDIVTARINAFGSPVLRMDRGCEDENVRR